MKHTGKSDLGRRPLSLVAITGTRGKSTVAWLLYHMARARQLATGLWCTSGVFINGHRLEGELHPWTVIVRALAAGELDLAIQELEAPVVASVGLPEASYGYAAITTLCSNDDGCLLAPETRYAARAHEIVARAVHPLGTLVLNADDPAVLDLAEHADARIVLFGLHPENPAIRRCRETSTPAIWCREGVIVANRALWEIGIHGTSHRSLPSEKHLSWGAYETLENQTEARSADFQAWDSAPEIPILDVRDAPCTLGGTLTFQIQNIMSAAALALALGVPLTTIRTVARTFLPDATVLPGACNLFSLQGRDVLIDGARYPWMLRPLVRGIRQRNPRHTFVLVHDFPWLSADELYEVGRLLGKVRGLILVYGSPAEERLTAFREGIVHNPMPPVVALQPSLDHALRSALNLSRPGDLLLIIADNAQDAVATLEQIEREST